MSDRSGTDGEAITMPLIDHFDQQLRDNVHPADWKNPTPDLPYQLVVIGAGTAGLVTAAGAAGLGARVALIEKSLMGGDCLNVGCVPSKAMIRSARVAATIHQADRFGIHVKDTDVGFAEVMRRMRRLRAEISPHDSAKRFSDLGVDVYFGAAAFVDRQTLEIRSETGTNGRLSFKKAVIATGARAKAPDIENLNQVDFLTNETLFSLTELPDRLGIIGAGPIGCEMAQTFARLGSTVALFDRSERLLSHEDPDASDLLKTQFEREGVQLCLGCKDLRVGRVEQGIEILTKESRGPTTVDQLLVATGRAPNIEHLNLEAAGIEATSQGVTVDHHLQTTNPNVFAAGDVCSKTKFTHAADFQARTVIQNALFAIGPFGKKNASKLIIPRVTYTSPEIAHVGLSEQEAADAGVAIQSFVQSMDGVDRAVLDESDMGYVKIHVRSGSDQIVGATVVAEHAGELISEITMAMNTKTGLSKLASHIHPYPTQADAIRKVGDQFNRTKLTPLNKRILAWLMRWNVGR
ncbi:mercuric reductase [Stieleria sp. JC731]|uniref:mercuric reductase n=1 Tax=Pirellulaceae TaxID=2691357 RepID=UPI001E300B83|nr:mercuric reductase [Stieleria sp. JC731]MCC9599028.1 mercuric reductase [Stieleria sp. JC731]